MQSRNVTSKLHCILFRLYSAVQSWFCDSRLFNYLSSELMHCSQGCSYFVYRIELHVCVCVHISNNISYTIVRIVYVLSSSASSQQEVSYLSMSK